MICTSFTLSKKIIINANQELNYVHIGAIMNQIQLLIRIINTIQARMGTDYTFLFKLIRDVPCNPCLKGILGHIQLYTVKG